MKNEKVSILKKYWMYIFLGAVLIFTVVSMIVYHYTRQDPVTITFKDAQGFTTTEIVYKHPNDTVQQVIDRANSNTENYVCNIDVGQKINTVNNLTLNERVNGTINVDGQVINFTSGAKTIQDVLKENNVTVSAVDKVTPTSTDILTQNNSNITIERINNNVETKTEILPYQSQVIENDNAQFNKVTVLQEGSNGTRTYTEEVVYQNGQPVDSYILSEERVEPVNEVLEIGTNLQIGKPEIEVSDIEAWRPYVIKALEMNGLSTDETMVNKVLRQIRTESDGDQNAHQEIFDLNSLLGEEARGLMQTIPSTFEEYKFEGYDDILNGFHNLLAALNYAKQRYGPSLYGVGEGHGY